MEEEQGEGLTLEEMVREWVGFYKIPLIFGLIGIFLLGGAVILWQSTRKAAKITFTQEATESGRIKVDIEGAIVNPGVYQLLSGSRIQDLLIAAGGLAAEADRDLISKNLNLAAKLTDGGKVYIPAVGEQRAEEGVLGYQDIASKVNINNASASELDGLPGIGPVTAQKIIDNRPYQETEELLTRKIVGKATFEKIKDKISIY